MAGVSMKFEVRGPRSEARGPSSVLCVLFVLAAFGLGAPADGGLPPNPFFALCMDTHDAKKRSLPEQAALLRELGYDGAGHLWLDLLPERLKTLDAVGLKLFQVYLRVDVATDSQPPYDPRLKEMLPLLRGRGVQLATLVSGGKPSDESRDPRAVELLREVAELAGPFGVHVVLYPHGGDWLERVEDAIRVAGKVDRSNVGVMFNLCHWLRTDRERHYRALLERAGSRLLAVSINGADTFDEQPGWDRYIQPLDRGSFEIAAFVRTLRELNYSGPIGLQCYGLGGDAREHLARSMAAWRRMNLSPAAATSESQSPTPNPQSPRQAP
jgi:sugar phosphate isomerase/epimerase